MAGVFPVDDVAAVPAGSGRQKLAAGGQAGDVRTAGDTAFRAGAADRLRLRGRQAARHAVCDVDAAGGADPQRHRNHSVLRFARPATDELHKLRCAGAAGVYVLSEVRRSAVAGVSAMPAGGGAGLDALRALRGFAAGGLSVLAMFANYVEITVQ